jgi:hypothetical protein
VKPPTLSAEALEQLRHELIGMKFGTDPARVARAEHLLKILDIVTTKDRAERHRRVQQLGVTITENPANDGRRGIVKTFFAGGTARARVFVPAKPVMAVVATTPATAQQDHYRVGGPSDSAEQIGRWKSDGNGGCYWDPNDEGIDQCSPPTGRWKSGGTCYWDPNDSGPAQCAPTYQGVEEPPEGSPTCSYNGQPDACASVQDGEDVMALAVSMEADLNNAQAALDSANEYCNQYGCDDDENELPRSGPSVTVDNGENCWFAGIGAVIDLGFGIWARIQLYALGSSIVVDAAAVAVADVAAAVIAATGSLVAGIVAVDAFVKCVKRREPAPIPTAIEPSVFLVN